MLRIFRQIKVVKRCTPAENDATLAEKALHDVAYKFRMTILHRFGFPYINL